MASLSKARTLERLAATPSPGPSFVIDPFVVFTVSDWQDDSKRLLTRLRSARLGALVIVRSSATAEDADLTIAPGMFQSSLGVPIDDEPSIRAAVERVVDSYGRHAETASRLRENEIIVQAQVVTAQVSGIAQLQTGSSYAHVDYDDESTLTNTVTAGRACKVAQLLLEVDALLPGRWSRVRQALLAVRTITGIEDLVVEFAVTGDEVVHVFQARKYAGPLGRSRQLSATAVQSLIRAADWIEAGRGVWSNMTDWNPAELIGRRPEPLSLSLYQYLITEAAWLVGRRSLGYRDVQPSQLVQTICGRPYVNVRASFLSLTPASLAPGLAHRLVEDRIALLRSEPWLHDKVETTLLFTAGDVVKPQRTDALRGRGFSASEVEEIDKHLQLLTREMLSSQPRWAAADARLSDALTLGGDIHNAQDMPASDMPALARAILTQLQRCRDLGIVPFARHARLAFVARDLLTRLRLAGAITAEWEAAWWAGTHTVVHEVVDAVRALAADATNRSGFNERVGHLRARTFDIRSPRYDRIDVAPAASSGDATPCAPVAVTADIVRAIEMQLSAASLPIGGIEFLEFATRSIQLRESLKFTFTRALSDALEAVAGLGERVGLTRTQMAFCDVADIEELAAGPGDAATIKARLEDRIAARREEWLDRDGMMLPDVIFEGTDILFVKSLPGRPNFITEATSEGPVVMVQDSWAKVVGSLDGTIVAIESADPGFDWIFSFRLAGLVTKYGGATSHMAIRCAQLHIPAAIGCGEVLFNEIVAAAVVRLDCALKQITSMRSLEPVGAPARVDAI